ncbi:hypothetical protein ABH892_004443 [Paenibacillus sp. RC254]
MTTLFNRKKAGISYAGYAVLTYGVGPVAKYVGAV